jgi:hypothetical protein
VSNTNPRIGDVDPTHVGPPDLILHEIVEPDEVPEDIRKRAADAVHRIAERGERRQGSGWADVQFAARAMAFVEGTERPDYDDFGDARVWIFALSAESAVLGQVIVSAGGYASSSSLTVFARGEPAQHGQRMSLFSAIRTEPRPTRRA